MLFLYVPYQINATVSRTMCFKLWPGLSLFLFRPIISPGFMESTHVAGHMHKHNHNHNHKTLAKLYIYIVYLSAISRSQQFHRHV